MSTILQAVVLGIVQGLTEFMPISSSAHLIIVPWLFNWNDPALTSLTFDVALHLGTLLAVLVFFARDWISLIRAWFLSIREWKIGDDPQRRLAWFIVIGTIPGGIAGILGENAIEGLFHQPGGPDQAGGDAHHGSDHRRAGGAAFSGRPPRPSFAIPRQHKP